MSILLIFSVKVESINTVCPVLYISKHFSHEHLQFSLALLLLALYFAVPLILSFFDLSINAGCSIASDIVLKVSAQGQVMSHKW